MSLHHAGGEAFFFANAPNIQNILSRGDRWAPSLNIDEFTPNSTANLLLPNPTDYFDPNARRLHGGLGSTLVVRASLMATSSVRPVPETHSANREVPPICTRGHTGSIQAQEWSGHKWTTTGLLIINCRVQAANQPILAVI